MFHDLRHAVRGLRKTPIFTAVAIGSLTLAIGANTAIFSLLNALLLRELPVRHPRSLVQIATRAPESTFEGGLTYSMFGDVSGRTDLFSGVIGWRGTSTFNVVTDSGEARGAVWLLSGNFFSELGVRPFAGRALGPEDENDTTLEPASVAVLGYSFWQREFGGNTAAIGRQIRIESHPYTIVGIAPPGFRAVGWIVEPDLMLPLTAYPVLTDTPQRALRTSGSFWVQTIGRLTPGTTLAQAQAALEAAWPALKRARTPSGFAGAQLDRFLNTRLVVRSAARGVETGLRNRFTQPLVIVFGIAALVLLISCVNLASLMLSRTAARRHEIGVRLALGAARWRVARPIVVEGLLLSAAGAACGIGFADVVSRRIVALIFNDYLVAASLDVAPDARILLFAAAVAIAVGVLFSGVPALRATRIASSQLLQSSSRTVSRVGRTGRLLVGVQVALSLVLLTNAGLLVRTIQEIRAVNSGMRGENVLVAYPRPRPGGYGGIDNDAYYPDVIGRLSALPGVSNVAISLSKPAGGGIGGGERVASTSSPPDAPGVASLFTTVSPGFFDTLGIPMVSGRDFAWRDSSRGVGVAILSESLARRLFPDRPAVGQRIRVGVLPRRQNLEVVGVVADARVYDLKDPNVAAVYMPALQEPDASYKCFVIRGSRVSAADLNRVVDALGREHIGNVETLDHITDAALLQERLAAGLAAFFGALALALAAIGLYGLMSYAVAQRRREIGIRMALGADSLRVTRDVVGDGLTITLVAVVVGFVASLASAGLVKSLLFGVTPRDPLTLAGAPLALVAVATVASLLPARRAARTDPMVVLRAE
jgi:predicted permease